MIFTTRSYATEVYAVVVHLPVCLYVCLSVTCQYCIRMAKLKMTQTMPHNSPGTLVLTDDKTSLKGAWSCHVTNFKFLASP